MSATTPERRERILAAVIEKRHVTARDLAVELAVSEATVRRDLRLLADSGQLELVYGGATLRRPSDFSFHTKGERNVEAKRAIGQLAASLVGDDQQIFLDSGTTCFHMAAFLKRRQRLSVVVSSARLVTELDAPGLNVIMLGGQYRPDRMDCVGPLATATLDQLRGYVAFIGADGLSMDFGPAAADIESAHLYRRAVQHAREAVLLVDHSKFTSPSLFKIVEWKDITTVVTDRAPDPAWSAFLDGEGIRAIWPQSAATPAVPPALAQPAGPSAG